MPDFKTNWVAPPAIFILSPKRPPFTLFEKRHVAFKPLSKGTKNVKRIEATIINVNQKPGTEKDARSFSTCTIQPVLSPLTS